MSEVSHVSKKTLMDLIAPLPENTKFMVGFQSLLDMEDEWSTKEMLPIRSLCLFKENNQMVVTFGIDSVGVVG